MFVYQTPKDAFQRLLINDQSGNFKIIIEIKYTKKQSIDIEIQKQKQIIINTTVNKARVISKKIDGQFANNQKIEQYVFNLGDLNQNENYKMQLEDIVYIFRALIDSNGNDITITEDKRNLLNQILNILDNGGNIEMNIIECKFLDNKFDGIISYIKRNARGTVDGKNDNLRLSGTGTLNEFPLSNLLLYDDSDIKKGYVNSANGLFTENDAFIEFDFVNKKINMTSYTIRTIYNCKDTYHPKTWKFVGSNDRQIWEVIDMKENNEQLNGVSYCAHFECSNPGKYYRYIKYVQIDNWRNNYGYVNEYNYRYYVGLSAIEFFGSIKLL
ncbi:hypothetical protein M9Y10_006832 [Tritrichomonas musculus]|uniref:F5/8 type C domain-containing protein n=1 Tax=Tritrichomonas musculus TaxID=1915356 RepID=A0ABR2JFR4_9EUKA